MVTSHLVPATMVGCGRVETPMCLVRTPVGADREVAVPPLIPAVVTLRVSLL